MNQFLRKISFRYLFRRGTKTLSSQTLLTASGVGVGTAVLIVVLSVMNGFENELQKRILGVIPHITLEKSGGFERFPRTRFFFLFLVFHGSVFKYVLLGILCSHYGKFTNSEMTKPPTNSSLTDRIKMSTK